MHPSSPGSIATGSAKKTVEGSAHNCSSKGARGYVAEDAHLESLDPLLLGRTVAYVEVQGPALLDEEVLLVAELIHWPGLRVRIHHRGHTRIHSQHMMVCQVRSRIPVCYQPPSRLQGGPLRSLKYASFLSASVGSLGQERVRGGRWECTPVLM